MSRSVKILVHSISAVALVAALAGLAAAARAESPLVINPFPLEQTDSPAPSPPPVAAAPSVPLDVPPVIEKTRAAALREKLAVPPREAYAAPLPKPQMREELDPITMIQSVRPAQQPQMVIEEQEIINWRRARVKSAQAGAGQAAGKSAAVMGAPTALMQYDSYSASAVPGMEAAPVQDVSPQNLMAVQPAAAPDSDTSGTWQAMPGADISAVLKAWADQEGVELIWAAGSGFSVMEPVRYEGPFEGAVVDLLEQYKDVRTRPVADLHVDPRSGRRTLVVQVFSAAS